MSTNGESDPDDDVTRLSPRVPSEDDDTTRLSPRLPTEDDDATRIAQGKVVNPDSTVRAGPRSASTSSAVQDTARVGGLGGGLAPLPPGVAPNSRTQAGAFGSHEPAYQPRAVPATHVARVNENPTTASAVDASDAMLSPEQSAQRRDAARRKRFTAVLVVTCVSAALLAGATVGVVMLVGGGP